VKDESIRSHLNEMERFKALLNQLDGPGKESDQLLITEISS